ncbi:MAG: Fe-S cluster assembly protein SufB [Mycoplasmoidaceae bacterium]
MKKYDFNTKSKIIISLGDKLSEELVRKISKIKNEPDWMLQIRLSALKYFFILKQPNFGPDLNFINFDDYKYYSSSSKTVENNWDYVDKEIRDTFNKIGIIEAEKVFLDGSSSQFDSETIYKNISDELMKKKVIFSNIEKAMITHPEIVKNYFGKLVSYTDNKYAALNTAVWSGGTFIYVPDGVVLNKPLQSYFRINQKGLGQFERTLIIAEENANINYIEGCTASINREGNIHAAVVEVFVGKNSLVKYTTIQNWSKNVLNLVTKRARVEENGTMLWIDGNIGSKINMKYPCSILKGDNSKSDYISIAVASNGVQQDTGAKMIHIGNNTKSRIISKSISMKNGKNTFRGLVDIKKSALNSHSYVQCDSLLVDRLSISNAIPREIVNNNTSYIDHEATISTINPDKLEYLLFKGISKDEAEKLLILGFANNFNDELPMEYALEFNYLLKQDIDTRKNDIINYYEQKK